MKNLIILAGLVVIFLFDLNVYLSLDVLNKYLYEYIMVDVLLYVVIFLVYILLYKISKYDFNVKFAPNAIMK